MFFHLGAVEHDVHLSKSEVNYDSKTQTIQVSISLFLDDMEVALAARGIEDVKLFSSYEAANAEEAIEVYLSEKLRFKPGRVFLRPVAYLEVQYSLAMVIVPPVKLIAQPN